MLNVIKEQKDNTLAVRMAGSIEESVNFEQLIGPTPAEVVINTKEVPRINSIGVKAWIKYFQAVQGKGTKLRFVECSMAIVEQMNLISNFVGDGTVESVCVPFVCEKCKSELVGVFTTNDLKKLQLKLPELKCTKCGGKALFDDLLEYFDFLNR